MPSRAMYCCTCDSDEQHRSLTANEKVWLKNLTGRKNVEEFFMCNAPSCRNVRSGFNKRPSPLPSASPARLTPALAADGTGRGNSSASEAERP
ncbi:hypothetical protein NKH18_02775 [Streptomyces sp. M10(2022)]